ncbi:cytochrome c class I [Deinococcus proteolyticus MRP]|uniref:Cytochrome c class I n=1 Tax=Deinococcus proteolyticus (strain ATCC 35074 / DSM 20540 / JCM 6276 / NBRC 101906 / NCIMB 13154 / VKM Ac-1939 / CCM 2703 / MRP) TaxID=693977 RepID=F0RP61_DEIPM|nr:cytochrome c [Deinococcus proteolyticus]ADY25376.1 cytochrome c class I [Deinococcus proteolyticus MRP]
MNEEHQGFSFAEAAVWLLGLVLTIQIGWLAYSMGQGIAGRPFADGRGAAAGATMAAVDSSAPQPANGPQLFAGNCAGCHGAKAEGGVGPSLKTAAGWTLAEFTEATLHGKTPDGRSLAPIMPHFADTGFSGEAATDQQLEAIHTYLGTLQ